MSQNTKLNRQLKHASKFQKKLVKDILKPDYGSALVQILRHDYVDKHEINRILTMIDERAVQRPNF